MANRKLRGNLVPKYFSMTVHFFWAGILLSVLVDDPLLTLTPTYYTLSVTVNLIKATGPTTDYQINTRMHSSRMRTVRNSSHLLGGGGVQPPFNQKAITDGHHTRRPQQKATQPPPEQAPPRSRHPPMQGMLGYPPPCKACWDNPPPCKACWDTQPHPGDLLQGMLGYHLQCIMHAGIAPQDRHTPIKT